MSESLPLVAVYADESCLGNGREGANPGGAGVLIEFRHADGRITRRDVWISEPGTTNNRMALRSVIETFRALGAKGQHFRVHFTSDSRYLIDGLSSWLFGWSRAGWKRKTGPIENLELWKEACRASVGHRYSWHWVRGHNGHPQNEYANHLATRAAADQTQSGGAVESQFESWLAAYRAKGGRTTDIAPFPDSDSFKAAPTLPRVD